MDDRRGFGFDISVGKAVTPWKGEHQPVLFLDVAGAHLPKTVMVAAKKAGIHLLFIPSSTTSLVQPLDVFGFGAFKVWLKQKYQEQRQAETDGQPQLLAWLYHLSQAPQFFFAARKWKRAFEGVGIGNVAQLHSRLAAFMNQPKCFPPPVKPAPEAFSLLWPKRRKMGYAYASLL